MRGPVFCELLPHHHGEGLQVLAIYQHWRLSKDVEALLAELRAEDKVGDVIGVGALKRLGLGLEERGWVRFMGLEIQMRWCM